jgi:hypothetical protein
MLVKAVFDKTVLVKFKISIITLNKTLMKHIQNTQKSTEIYSLAYGLVFFVISISGVATFTLLSLSEKLIYVQAIPLANWQIVFAAAQFPAGSR